MSSVTFDGFYPVADGHQANLVPAPAGAYTGI